MSQSTPPPHPVPAPQSDALLRGVMESSCDLIAALNAGFRFIAFNSAYQQAFQATYGRSPTVGGSLIDLLAEAPDEQQSAINAWDRALRGEKFTMVREFGDPEQEPRTYEVVYNVLRDETGRPFGAVHVGRDVTDRIRAGRELAQLSAKLERRVSDSGAEGRETAERLRAVVNAAVDGIITIDERGTIETVNPAAMQIFGYTAGELIGRNVKMLMPEPDRSQHDQYLANYLRTGERKIIGIGREVTGRRKDGSTFPLELSISESRLGDYRLFTGIVRDITERKRAEERFRLAIEASPNGQVLITREGTIVMVNSATERIFGYLRQELLGQPVEILVPLRFRGKHPEYRNEFFARPLARPMGAGRDLFGLRKDGTEFPVEIGLNPIETDEGLFVLSAIVDITQRKRAELDLRRTAENLARSNAELEQFAYVASHDLQEPLRAIAGCVQLLQAEYQGRLGADADEYIRHAVDAAVRMRTLIYDLLEYSRLSRGKAVRERVDCEVVFQHVLRNLEAAIVESYAVVTHDPLPALMADATQLVQVFQNLIGNAIKFRGESTPRIHVGAERTDGQWLFSVHDNGIGIEAEYLDRIFRVFQRLHTRQEQPGSGIGLAICKKVIEQHGGRIWVESQAGAGSTFFFTIPEHHESGSSVREPAEPAGRRET